MTLPSACDNQDHGPARHDATCLPPPDRSDPEMRLLRALYGICPDCDLEVLHEHA